MHSELAAVGSKSERISASHTDVAQRMRPISRARDTHMYALGSRDSAAAIVREQQRGAAPRRRAIGKALYSIFRIDRLWHIVLASLKFFLVSSWRFRLADGV